MATPWKVTLQTVLIAAAAFGWFLFFRSHIENSSMRTAVATKLAKDNQPEKSPSPSKEPSNVPQTLTASEGKPKEAKQDINFNELWRSQPKYSPKRRNRTFQREVEKDYTPLIKQLGLTPEVQAKLKSLLVERKHLIMDAHDIAKEKGDRSTDFALKVVAEASAPVDSEIETLLGPDKYGLIRSTLDNGLERGQIQNGWSLDLSYADRALTPIQEVKLAEILHAAMAPSSGTSPNRASKVDPTLSEVEEQLLTEAAQFLSQDQLLLIKGAIVERRLSDSKPLKND